MNRENQFANPYLAGVALGLVMLTAFLVMGKGLGASGAASRLGIAAVGAVAAEHVASNSYMASASEGVRGALDNWFVFEILGVFLGGAVSAYAAGRMRLGVVRGPRAGVRTRLMMAFGGGILMGMAARLARGCTSGQALSGGALMSAGAWVFMLAVFAGGYGLAWFVRRQWT
jgi:hypothetical protein